MSTKLLLNKIALASLVTLAGAATSAFAAPAAPSSVDFPQFAGNTPVAQERGLEQHAAASVASGEIRCEPTASDKHAGANGAAESSPAASPDWTHGTLPKY